MTATILVVDDEPDLEALVLQKFRRQIREGLISFMFAHDGLDALHSLELHPDIDFVVSDINMPRMDGLTLLAKLQQADDKKSTVIVSAYGDMRNIRIAMNRGAFDFVTKPIDFADLEATIDKTLPRAVACAQDLDAWAEAFRARWRAREVHFGVTRIGVHAGPALVGNFSEIRFFDYAAYGDTINTAARLEVANKFLGTRICVSAAVADMAENFRGRPFGDLILRGRSMPLRTYEPLSPARFSAPALGIYAQAFAKLEAGDAAAMPAFAALVGLHADDALAGLHLKRLLNGAKGVRMQVE
jgi:class 3 adenylate cyclase